MSDGGDEAKFSVKELVDVARRKFPGFNFDGGVAQIMKCNDERDIDIDAKEAKLKDGSGSGRRTTNFTYNVKYVLGGSERRVDAQWITSKREKTRDELSLDRAKDLAAKKAQREAEEAAAAKLEELRLAKNKMLRERLGQRRAQRDAQQQQQQPVKKKAKTAPTKKRDVENDAPNAAPNSKEEDKEEVVTSTYNCPVALLSAASANAKWVKTVVASVAAAEETDEIAMSAIVLAAKADSQRPIGEPTEDNLRPLLMELDERNYVMLVENSIFII